MDSQFLHGSGLQAEVMQRCRKGRCSLEEAHLEIYLGTVPQGAGTITGAAVSIPESESPLRRRFEKIGETIAGWRNRRIDGVYPYVYLGRTTLRFSAENALAECSLFVATGVATDGHRDVLGVVDTDPDRPSLLPLLDELRERGLKGCKLLVSEDELPDNLDAPLDSAEAQCCTMCFTKAACALVPKGKSKKVALLLKAIHAQENQRSAWRKAREVVERLRAVDLLEAATFVEEKIAETLAYFCFPHEHWRYLRTNDPLARILRDARGRVRAVQGIRGRGQAVLVACARLRFIQSKWDLQARPYVPTGPLHEPSADVSSPYSASAPPLQTDSPAAKPPDEKPAPVKRLLDYL